MGAVRLSFGEVLTALLHPSAAGDAGVILFTLRLPRVLAAGLVGAGLSATGVLFQGLFRNPLADPFILGASGGAALGGAIAVFLFPSLSFAGFGAIELLAFGGSLLAMAIVWSLAKSGGHFAMENMLLAGFAVGTMLNAATAALALRQEESNPGLRILTAIGADESDLGDRLREVAAPLGVAVQNDLEPQRNLFIRSDQYNFIQRGIPALAFKVGYTKGSPEEAISKTL